MRFKHVALGCMAIPAVLVLVAAIFFLVAWLQGPLPEFVESDKKLDEPVPRSIVRWDPDDPAPEEATRTDLSRATVLSVRLDLEEGEFEITPDGVAGTIQVDADYREGVHQLEPKWSETDTGPLFELRFRGGSLVQDIRTLLYGDGHDEPRVRVDLPRGVPMHLTLDVRKCAADIDLSGLSLLSLTYEHAMGSSVLLFREPNPIEIDVLDIRAEMGDVEIEGLGNASAREFVFKGRMGDFRLDFDGEWKTDTIASVSMTMGSATLRVPRDIVLDHDNRSVIFGAIETPRRGRLPDAEGVERRSTLFLQTSVRFGEVSVR